MKRDKRGPLVAVLLVAAVPSLAVGRAALAQVARTPADTMSYHGADWLTRPERTGEEQPEAMLDALRVPAGAVVADIGAGVGYHSWRLAQRVGVRGKVYATDLQPEMLALLARNMKERGIGNVVAVQSGQEQTGLPDGAIDLALMVDVYHELSHPQPFLTAMRRALKPGGRLALVEFRGEDPKVPIRPEHKMTAEQVIAELREGGFELQQREEFLPWQHLLVFGVAAGAADAACSRPGASGAATPPACLGLDTPSSSSDAGAAPARSVLGGALASCGSAPLTGFRRNGLCDTGPDDAGVHVICAQLTRGFLDFSRSKGNDLITPLPAFGFPGLLPGQRWCLCAERYREALDAGFAPPVDLRATHARALDFLTGAQLEAHALRR